jgi:YVTN family beta-propeller protein
LRLLLGAVLVAAGCRTHETPGGRAHFASPQVAPLALAADGLLYVAHTPSDKVHVVDTGTRRVLGEIDVGIEPVSLALRPDGRQLFVSNHVSDSVAVIDTDPRSPNRHHVVEIIQDLDPRGATRFDEPVGIAFASDDKAYVALSSRNEIAVLVREGERWQVRPERIRITAQEPRAIAVRDGRLYVLAFESSNQSELSNCARGDDPPQCSFGPLDPPPTDGKLPKHHIVIDPDVPDRDLFVFDTADEKPLDVVEHVGTLLYGLAVGPGGRVFVAHTDARNHVNGLHGGRLDDLDNRMYLNRIARVACAGKACAFEPEKDVFALEPAPPEQPENGRQLATPYAIAVSDDGRTLVATAAASGRVFRVDAESGHVQDVLDVGHLPRGIALRSGPDGTPETAWVWNSLDSTLSVVDLRAPGDLAPLATLDVGHDPTPEAVRRGRIAFESASASSSGTFACGSCHPDAHMDQLIWRIGGGCDKSVSPLCGLPAPRTTKPIRGLRHTLPLHWDGALGDPFGGPNGAVGLKGDGGTDCALGDADGDHDCFLDLVRVSLSEVMCDHHPCSADERLPTADQGDMATFLASVWHPPGRSRAIDDRVSESALAGFSDFFTDQGGIDRGSCADTAQQCHVLPLGVSTNGTAPVTAAFDAPGVIGLTDRYMQQSIGGNSSEEMLHFMNAPYGLQGAFDGTPPSKFPYDPEKGYDEASTFAVGFLYFRVDMGPDASSVDIFQMVEEMSTGSSGATGRQVLLDANTLETGEATATQALLTALEAADARGVVQLGGEATRLQPQPNGSQPVAYVPERNAYRVGNGELARDALLDEARTGALRVALTARLPAHFGDGAETQQPLLSVLGIGPGPTGDPALPVLTPGVRGFTLRGIEVAEGARIHVDGELARGQVLCAGGKFAPRFCDTERVEVRLAAPPTSPGLHLVQLQNPQGPLSNELPVCVPPIERCR